MEVHPKQDGYGTISDPDRFLGQDYHKLREYCLGRGVRYVDDEFPPNGSSIGQGILKQSDLALVKWLRPRDIAPNPTFILGGISRFDFGQGGIGNCWFLASIGALTFEKVLLHRIVPPEQTFDENYCGLFHFRFWRFGRWVDVVIDDKLPVINGRLIFVHSKARNEFWPALMEKAYAKVCGSYTDMSAGTPSEAMMDFTGGVHMSISLLDPPPDLFDLMCRAGKSSTLLCCGTPGGVALVNTVLPNGLVQGHAYTVTGVTQMMSQGKLVHLVRLWNPWGKREWTGDWSDHSSLWQTVSPQDRKKCLSVADDGEFWMTIQDFIKFYTDLDICGLSPDFLDAGSSCAWRTSMYEGRWIAGTTAGGCMNNSDSFWTNPQYRVRISGEAKEKHGEKNILLSLMQKPGKRNRRLVQNLHIGFAIFEVTQEYAAQRGKFPASFFSRHAPVTQTKSYVNAREVMAFLMLSPGEYLIVPSTFNPNKTASFLLTIYSKEETQCGESSEENLYQPHVMPKRIQSTEEDKNKRGLFLQFSDKLQEVDAEQLQRLLNENILKGDLKSGGFSIDACRSMVALMDTSVSGRLNSEEFISLWNRVVAYKDIFFLTDVSRTGTLLLNELREAISATGIQFSDAMLDLMALRYGASSGHMTLESFISLILRLECMNNMFDQLSDGKGVSLGKREWLYISMYS